MGHAVNSSGEALRPDRMMHLTPWRMVMKRIVVCGLLAIAVVSLSHSTASAICFDVYRPCIRLPLPRLPVFLPNFCIGCDPEGRQSCGGQLLFNKSSCGTYKFCSPDCNRPMYPNPGLGYNCWNGQVAPWYTYFPPTVNTGYQVGSYGAFRGPAGATVPHAVQRPPAAYAPAYGNAYAQNVPSYWYGR